MGTWGHKIFDDDLALDVKETFLSFLYEGKSPREATAQLTQIFSEAIADLDDQHVYWLALAETQWDYGRLLVEVAEQAVAILNKPIDRDRWGELVTRRSKELERLASKLEKPQPKKKRLVRRKPKLDPGDVFSFSPPGNRQVTFYGRHLTDVHNVFYDMNAERQAIGVRHALALQGALDKGENPYPVSVAHEFELEDVLRMDVAFIGSCLDGFVRRRFRILGNVPLEAKFKEPIYFYSRGAGSDVCHVFDIWAPHTRRQIDIQELPVGATLWKGFTFEYLLRLLGYPE